MIKQFEEATKAGAAVIAVVYLFGFLVNALYFGRYGIAAISLVRLQYILAGVWVLLPFGIGAAVLALVAYAFGMEYELADDGSGTKRPANWHLKRLGNGIAGLLGLGIILWLLLRDLFPLVRIGAGVRGSLGVLALYVMGIALLAFLLLAIAVSKESKRPYAERLTAIGFTAFLVVALLGYVAFFAARVYPHLPAALGGGAPTAVKFRIGNELVPHNLLLLTDKTAIVLVGEQAIEMSREPIDAIHYP